MNLQGKVALVTGSAKRIGRAIALALAKEGCAVAVHCHTSQPEAARTVKNIRSQGVPSTLVTGDLCAVTTAQKIVSETVKKFGRLDILVHNASIYEKMPFEKISERDWDQTLDVNLKAAFFLSQAVCKIMKRQKSGKIIHILDARILRPHKNYLPYFASKAGLEGLVTCLAKELAPKICVNAVSPGPVLLREGSSRAYAQAVKKATPLEKIGSPEDVARAVLFCAKQDYMTGSVINVDGGQHFA